MFNKNEKNLIIFLIIIIIIYFNNYTLCLNETNTDEITIIVEKFLNPLNIPILNKNEILISKYWNENILCPFSKLISHGLTKKEALLIIDFFKIEKIEDLNRLLDFKKN